MRLLIGILVLVAVGAAGSTRRSKQAAHSPNAAAPVHAKASIESEEQEASASPSTEESTASTAGEATPSLPLFEVGPEEPEDEAALNKKEPSPTPPASTQPAPTKEETKSEPPRVQPPKPRPIEHYQEFFSKMLRFELSEIRDCYRDAQRRYPRLHRDFRLTFTVYQDAEGEKNLESSAVDSNFYLPPAFQQCVQKAVEDIILPPVNERITVSIPVILNPAGLYDDDDDY